MQKNNEKGRLTIIMITEISVRTMAHNAGSSTSEAAVLGWRRKRAGPEREREGKREKG